MSLLADREHLPKVVTNIDGIKDILLAIDPEIILLRKDIKQSIKELYVKTTDKYLTYWEGDFGLDHNLSLSLKQRRARILNKMARKNTLTWQNLKRLIRNNITNPQIYLMNDSKNYHFRIIVQDKNIEQLKQAVSNAKPAYLTFDIIVTEYFRRCGTFNCGADAL